MNKSDNMTNQVAADIGSSPGRVKQNKAEDKAGAQAPSCCGDGCKNLKPSMKSFNVGSGRMTARGPRPRPCTCGLGVTDGGANAKGGK